MEAIEERNQQLEIDDKKYIWHPFTQMQDYVKEESLIIESGDGCILTDIHGNEYIDGVSSLWTNVHGHRKKAIDSAIKKQLDKIAHSTLLGLSNVPAIRYAKKIVEITPKDLTRVFYSDSGSTAVEIALKIAFQYQQQAQDGNPEKKKFISLYNSYHGDTIGSVSVGGIDLFHSMYKHLLFESIKAESPYCYRCAFGKSYPGCKLECLSGLEEIMSTHANEVTAMVIEPLVQGASGMLLQPPGYLKKVRELCDKYNIFMIADEVAVGFGKTGKMFACEHEDVTPDIMALAKGISGGYLSLAATLATEKIYKGFLGKYEEFKTFFHGHTYTGNPLACAAAIANLEIFEEEKVLNKLQAKIEHFKQRLQSFTFLDNVGDVRQCGIMAGIEIVADKDTKEPFPPGKRIGQRVMKKARKRGLIIRPLGDVIVLMPPLSISIDEIDRLCDITYESIQSAKKQE
ncbi:MAG: adenosylmethionine--8-amino-7-oxononanoate transaminase [Desulfobacteraceae bacterium]|nr:adenosylmethionine--8-amino-7-oxononanoate transaminase [Desulfobacteraceae bacterium]MBC2718090.1 adenosylmethionine--8-amino-7-oxononanoate transaminase [Desulfobacteraceae bacterium]